MDQAMPALKKQLGAADCVVFPPSNGAAKLCVILCHGFGAPGTDLVPLAFELFELEESLADTVQFVFPAGPIALDADGVYGGRAWWQLDVNAVMNAIARGDVRILRDALPPGLPEARSHFASLLDAVRDDTGLPTSRLLLGGFSQGAMIAADAALRLPESPAALAIFSGTLLAESVWRPLAPSRRGLPVLQTHGRYDPILPFVAAEWLRDMLLEAGLKVDFVEFPGEHTIPLQGIRKFAALIKQLVDNQE
jgi:phospholipase/carboxylesterase